MGRQTSSWTPETLADVVVDIDRLDARRRERLRATLNDRFPPAVYERHRAMRRSALANLDAARRLLDGARRHYPPVIRAEEIAPDPAAVRQCAVVFTAGGEGERLRLSLRARGVPPERLEDFTKATYPLPGFFGSFGTLQCNLSLVSHLCRRYGCDIPVVITTGPRGSVTARIIPRIVEEHRAFGLKNVGILEQSERLHLTDDEKIAWHIVDGEPCPVTNPDETGGPLMGLAHGGTPGGSMLAWFESLGCGRVLCLQATALYDRDLIPLMASVPRHYDCVGVGIPRERFDPGDPFGSPVIVEKEGRRTAAIIEQHVRDAATMKLTDPSGQWYLPANTGFYVFDAGLLERGKLPDYATPPKEILPHLPRAPKIGYAATDILSIASNPAILTIPGTRFDVLKKADDLERLARQAEKFGLRQLCREVDSGGDGN